MSLKRSLPIRLVVAVAGVLALPFTFDPTTRELKSNEALCDGGTCCPENKAVCYPGSCSDQFCAEKDHYWRGDGKKCEDPEG